MKMSNGITAHIELSNYFLEYQPRWLVAGGKGMMIVKNFACEVRRVLALMEATRKSAETGEAILFE